MTLRSIVQLRVANALTTKPPSLSYFLSISCFTLKQNRVVTNPWAADRPVGGCPPAGHIIMTP
jgi:hypothetical protein